MVTSKIRSAIDALNQGSMIILIDLNGKGKLLSLVEKATPNHVNFMITHARGLVSVGIEEKRARELGIELQRHSYTNDSPAYTVSVDVEGTTTGISSFERYDTIKALIDSKRKSNDFKRPGHIFPIIGHQEGLFAKQTHVEGGIELAKLNDSYPAVVMCDILSEKGDIAKNDELTALSSRFKLCTLRLEELIIYNLMNKPIVAIESRKKIKNYIGEFDLISYKNGLDSDTDQIFLSRKVKYRDSIPVYIHKKCDSCLVKGCECHLKLEQSLSIINNQGGICIYISDRKNNYTVNMKEQVTTMFAINMLHNLNVKKIKLMNQELCNEELFNQKGIYLDKKESHQLKEIKII